MRFFISLAILWGFTSVACAASSSETDFYAYGFYSAIAALIVAIGLLWQLTRRLKQQTAAHNALVSSLEESNQLFNLIFLNSPIGFIIQDADGKIIRTNTAINQILGTPINAIEQHYPLRQMIIDPHTRQQFSEYYEKMLKEPMHLHNWEVEILTPTQQKKCLRINGQTLIHENAIKGVFWIIEDITREHLARQTLEHLSSTDALTGLLNRRAFLRKWKEESPRALRHGYPLTLVLIDLDHFKQLNDQWGHHIGDEVLKWFAAQMQQNLRPSDFIARLGGEEFAILMPHTDEPAANRAIEHLRQATHTGLKTDTGKTLSPTFSAGISQWHPPEPFERLYQRADRALYHAKEQGRNRTSCASLLIKQQTALIPQSTAE